MQYTEFDDACASIEARFGTTKDLRLSHLDLGAVCCKRLLNFGAGKLDYSALAQDYHTLDADPDLKTTYKSLDEVSTTFDAVLADQVFEHISKDEISGVVQGLSRVMAPGATILATIPNVCNWFKYVSDYDHRNPLVFYQLGALFEMHGIKVVDVYRYTKRPEEILTATPLEQAVLGVLRKFFEMDPAAFVAVVGRKDASVG